MKGSRKGDTPPGMQAWLELANDDWQPAYPFDSSDVRNEVRTSLLAEQRGLCVYCGRKLNLARPGHTYHIEHFRPQTSYEHLTVNYENLFISCGRTGADGGVSQTCGAKKDDWFDEQSYVSPIYPPCTLRFRFLLTGAVDTLLPNDPAARNMISVLKLDHPELSKDRSDVLTLIDADELDETDFWDAAEQAAQSYAHVVFQHLGKTLP